MDAFEQIIIASIVPAEETNVPTNQDDGGSSGSGGTNCVIA